MKVKRKLEGTIKLLIKQFPILVILGPRQVGKTTLTKDITQSIKKNIIYLDLENPNDIKILEDNPEIYFNENKEKCVVIDEVQRLPSIFPRLRPITDDHRVPGRFVLLGSANPIILKEASESLASRVIYLELTPFNISEINKKDIYKLWFRGGFPEPYLMQNSDLLNFWFKSFLQTYFERDLPYIGLDIHPRLIYRTFIMLSHLQGNLCNFSTLSNSLGLTRQNIEKILNFFISSYIVRELPPFHINTKKKLIKTSKLYIRDTGIYHHTLNLKDFNSLLLHPSLGASWETFVIEQVSNLDINLSSYFYRTKAGAECDLVLVEGNEPKIAIEAKVNENPKLTKSFLNCIEDLGTKKNFIVIPNCKNTFKISQNVTVCDLNFLIQELLKDA